MPYILAACFANPHSSSPWIEPERQLTVKGRPMDTEVTVNSFDMIHSVYKMLLSNFLKFAHGTFYCLKFFKNVNHCTFTVTKYNIVLALCLPLFPEENYLETKRRKCSCSVVTLGALQKEQSLPASPKPQMKINV